MFSQEAASKYKNIVTGYGVDNTSNGKNLFLDTVPGQSEFANWSGFQFQEDTDCIQWLSKLINKALEKRKSALEESL